MRKQIIAAFVVVLFCGIFLFSCAEPEETDGAPPVTGILAKLQGTWSTGCHSSGVQEQLVVSGSDLQVTKNYYTNNSCSTSTYKTESTYSSLSIEDKITFWDGTSGYRFTYVIQSEEHTPLSVSQTNNFNNFNAGIGFCGLTSWITGVPEDILGRNCVGEPIQTIPKNTTMFNILNLVGNNLYLGDRNTITHPISPNTSGMYVKL